MVASPYGFLRGTAVVMAEDVAHLPATGITPVICGDAHLGNFGFYASPERDLVIDLNDFDEAHPGAWEWDLRRLVASIWVAGRQNGATEEQLRARRCASCVAAYRLEVRRLADEPLLSRSFTRLDVDRLRRRRQARCRTRSPARRSGRATGPATVRCRDSPRRWTASQIVEEPPLITRLPERRSASAGRGARRLPARPWPRTGAACWAATPWSTSRTRWSGVGSVGLRAYVALLEGLARTTSCSCSSSRPAARCWRATCTATRRGTRIRASGSSSTSRRCRRSATRCWAGRRSTACSTTCGSSAT